VIYPNPQVSVPISRSTSSRTARHTSAHRPHQGCLDTQYRPLLSIMNRCGGSIDVFSRRAYSRRVMLIGGGRLDAWTLLRHSAPERRTL